MLKLQRNCLRLIRKGHYTGRYFVDPFFTEFSKLQLPLLHPQLTSGVRCLSSENLRKDAKDVIGSAADSARNLMKTAPYPAILFGAAGLIPFIAAPWMCIKTGSFDPNWEFYQLTYGASILSFLGGVRWGLTLPPGRPEGALPSWNNLGYSVTPSLAAWFSLLLPNPIGVFAVALSLASIGYIDMALPGYPDWYKGLRLILSSVAIFSLLSMLGCRLLLKSRKSDVEK